jgi:hypothetical protein
MVAAWRALVLVLAAAPALAAEDASVRVARLGCAEGVQLTSRGAPLSVVLLHMSQQLGFELKYRGRDDPPIHWDARQQPVELMSLLAQRANVIVRYVPDRRCAGRARISSVHVLPAGWAAAPPRPTVASAVRPQAAAPVPAAAPFEYDEANAEYMRAHGIEPPRRPSAPAGVAASASRGRQ